MKKILIMMLALMTLGLTQCKKQPIEETDDTVKMVKVSCTIPVNGGGKSDFSNMMNDGSINWSTGTERVYLAVPDNRDTPYDDESEFIELTSINEGIPVSQLTFIGEIREGVLTKEEEYDIWYLGNSKDSEFKNYTESKEEIWSFSGTYVKISNIMGSIANQSGSLEDLGYCHIAKTTVKAKVTEADENVVEVVLSQNKPFTSQIAIACLDLNDVETLSGSAIIGTDYLLQYNSSKEKFEIVVVSGENINVTGEHSENDKSFVVMFPNATNDVEIRNNNDEKYTFKNNIEAGNVYYYASASGYESLPWEDCEGGDEGNANMLNGHEYVDLGLSVKWATCNIGAKSPEQYGYYYAWGEVRTKIEYTEDNYIGPKPKDTDTFENPDPDGIFNISNTEYDAAKVNWGEGWRMPTKEEWEELKDYCKWEWITQGDSNGYKITGPSGNSIFLPAAGCRYDSFFEAGEGDYSIPSICRDEIYSYNNPYRTNIRKTYNETPFVRISAQGADRTMGYTIRPVKTNE